MQANGHLSDSAASAERAMQAPGGFSGPDQPDPDILRRCIRCGLCLPSCPTYVVTHNEISSPRGRIHLISAVADGTLPVTDPTFVGQMYECLDCRACEDVCPSGVRYGQLIETARTQIERVRRRPARERAIRSAAFRGLFADMRRFRLAARGLRWYQRSGMRTVARASGMLARLGVADAERMLPTLSGSPTIPRDQHYGPLRAPTRGRVSLFAGCVMSTAFAATNRATIRVLGMNGYEVVSPRSQGCCGALTLHAGSMDDARVLARRNIAAFEASGASTVIVNAAGCGSTLKEYGRLLADDADWSARASAFADNVNDISEFLGSLQHAGALNTAFHPLPLRITYQEACHLAHAQRITLQPRQLLRAIPDLDLIELEEPKLCCGSAGIYNLTHPAMADQLAARKLRHILATGAQAVVTANPGCFLQLRAALERSREPIRMLHIVDVLDAAYRGADPFMSE